MFPKNNLYKIILIGTIIRLIIAPFTAHPFDVYSWLIFCKQFLKEGFKIDLISTLRPLWPITLILISYPYNYFSHILNIESISIDSLPNIFNPSWGIKLIPDPLFNLLVKVPMIISDILIAFLLYDVFNKYIKDFNPLNACIMWFLNPAIIWISAGWGQYDSIPTLFSLLSIYFILKNKFILSLFSLLFATLYKIYPIGLLIPITIYIFKKYGVKQTLKYIISFFMPLLFIFLIQPTILFDVISFIKNFFKSMPLEGISGFGLTYWSISLLYPIDQTIISIISNIIFILLIMFSLFAIYKFDFKNGIEDMALSSIAISATIFLSANIVSEPRYAWITPFLIIIVANNMIKQRTFWIISLIVFLYMQKNFPYYLLPITIINQQIIAPLFILSQPFRKIEQEALKPTIFSSFILAILGIAFSIIFLLIYLKILKEALKKNEERKI